MSDVRFKSYREVVVGCCERPAAAGAVALSDCLGLVDERRDFSGHALD